MVNAITNLVVQPDEHSCELRRQWYADEGMLPLPWFTAR